MIALSNTEISLLEQGYRQSIRIEFENSYVDDNGVAHTDTIRLTEKDIIEHSFKWDRYCTSGDTIEIGSAIAAEVEFTLINRGCFNAVSLAGERQVPIENIKFEGKELKIEIGISKSRDRRWKEDVEFWFDCGVFIVDTEPRALSTIDISALDRMINFDRIVRWELFSSTSYSLSQMLLAICTECGVTTRSISDFSNKSYTIQIDMLKSEVNSGITYRQLLMWIAQILGTCAFFDTEGYLTFKWYSTSTVQITPSKRYSSDVLNPISISGIQVTKDEKSLSLGSDSYALTIVDNCLIQAVDERHDWTARFYDYLQNIFTNTVNVDNTYLTYVPFSCSTVSMPYVEPLDIIEYTDNTGNTFNTIVTNVTFTLNGGCEISAKGESEQSNSTKQPILSPSEANIASKIKAEINRRMSAVSMFNEMFTKAMGLYKIEVTNEDDSIVFYLTSVRAQSLDDITSNITDTDVVYMINSEGFCWLKGASSWNNGNPQWENSITSDGNALLSYIYANGIEVSQLRESFSTIINPRSFEIKSGNELILRLGDVQSQINKLLVKSETNDPTEDNDAYIRIGNMMIVPSEDGADFIYLEG